MANLAEMAKATAPRNFDVDPSLTLEALHEKMAANASAFQMPFELKGGIGGDRIVFKREPDLDVALWVYVKNGNVKVQPNITDNKTNVGVGGMSMNIGKNSVAQRGVGGMMELPMRRGAYIDAVTETIQKIIAGETVEAYVAPAAPAAEAPKADAPKADAPKAEKSWKVALLLLIFLGGFGAHRFYVGRTGGGVLVLLTGGLCGIGWILDLVKLLTGKFADKDGNILQK